MLCGYHSNPVFHWVVLLGTCFYNVIIHFSVQYAYGCIHLVKIRHAKMYNKLYYLILVDKLIYAIYAMHSLNTTSIINSSILVSDEYRWNAQKKTTLNIKIIKQNIKSFIIKLFNWTIFFLEICKQFQKRKQTNKNKTKKERMKKTTWYGWDSNPRLPQVQKRWMPVIYPKRTILPDIMPSHRMLRIGWRFRPHPHYPGITPISLVIKEGGNSRILVPLNNCPAPLGYRARLLIWRTK